MLGGERGTVGSRGLAAEEAPGAQHEDVTHLLGSRSCCLWPGQKGLLGYLFSLPVWSTPGNQLFPQKTPGEEVSKHACFVFLLLFSIPGSSSYCLHRIVPVWAQAHSWSMALGQNRDPSPVGWATLPPNKSLSEVQVWL